MSASAQPWVLTVGDGSLSFSLCLAEKYNLCRVNKKALCQHSSEALANKGDFYLVASTYDDSVDQILKYREATAFRNTIHEQGGLVQGSVDATDLQTSLQKAVQCLQDSKTVVTGCYSFDLVIFNNPHLGFESAQHHHVLLSHFFHSSLNVLNASGQVHVTLCDDQPKRWGLFTAAYKQGFKCVASFLCRETDWPKYTHKRHQNGTSFPVNVMVTYVFVLIDGSNNKKRERKELEKEATVESEFCLTSQPPLEQEQPEPILLSDQVCIGSTPLVNWTDLGLQKHLVYTQTHPIEYQTKQFRITGVTDDQGDCGFKRIPKIGEYKEKEMTPVVVAAVEAGTANARQQLKLARLQARLDMAQKKQEEAKLKVASVQCTSCARFFVDIKGRDDHIRAVHATEDMSTSTKDETSATLDLCEVCLKPMPLHTLQPLDEEFPCPDCDRSFSNTRAQHQHTLFKHAPQ